MYEHTTLPKSSLFLCSLNYQHIAPYDTCSGSIYFPTPCHFQKKTTCLGPFTEDYRTIWMQVFAFCCMQIQHRNVRKGITIAPKAPRGWNNKQLKVRLLVNDMKKCDICTTNKGAQHRTERDLMHLSLLQVKLLYSKHCLANTKIQTSNIIFGETFRSPT